MKPKIIFNCDKCKIILEEDTQYNPLSSPFFWSNIPKGWICNDNTQLCKSCAKKLAKMNTKWIKG